MALNYMGHQHQLFVNSIPIPIQFAHFLISQGCRAGDVVGVHLLNVPASFFAAIGIQKGWVAFLPA